MRNAHETAIKEIPNADVNNITETLNKMTKTGWRINQNIFDIYQKCMHLEKTPFKFVKEVDPQKKASLLIETEAIEKLARRHLNNTFYHLYNVDFRGRIYPNTAFLHEQSSDNAKGILLLDEPVPLGQDGYYWLSVHTSNMWGNDKVSLDDRAKWVQENLDEILSYANDPLNNLGWMKADKPFCFLACCCEIDMISNWHGDGFNTEDFPSCLPIYIDGSNNGVQHLVAMSKDDEVAPLVNLTPSDLPGDVYMFIAEHVWKRIEQMYNELDKDTINKFDDVFNTALKLQREYENAPDKSERKKLAFQAVQTYRNHNRDLREKLFPVYWHNIQDKKVQRKTVKRNVMTLGYGGTAYGMGQQVNEDTRDINDYLRDKEHLWGNMLGKLVYETCYEELKGPARMLRLFQTLADRANEKGVYLSYITPITNFPVVQV